MPKLPRRKIILDPALAIGQSLFDMKKKTTYGFVTQTFNDDGTLRSQDFTAGDQVEWEDKNGDACDEQDNAYAPFEMKQP